MHEDMGASKTDFCTKSNLVVIWKNEVDRDFRNIISFSRYNEERLHCKISFIESFFSWYRYDTLTNYDISIYILQMHLSVREKCSNYLENDLS